MDAVTYPDETVISFILENFVPLRITFGTEPFTSDFNVKWTPSIITLDSDGREHHRTLGFLAPEEFIPSLYLGIGKSFFDSDKMEDAISYFDNIITEYPKSDFDPEALYLRGVSRYKSTNDPIPLKEAYEELNQKFPLSEWTKRAYPYRLIN